MGVPTKIILEGGNILIKDAADNILKILISQETFAHPSNVDVEFTNEGSGVDYIYFNNSPSNRETFGERISISCSEITVPAPPLGGWNMNNLLQELSDNYLGKTAPVTVDTTGLATEAKQDAQIVLETAIKLNTDYLDVALSTRASEATQLGVLETISLGSNQVTTIVAGSVTSVLLVSARAKRKEVIVRNDTNKKMYICPFTPATTATAIVLGAGQEWVLDKYDGAYYALWETGVTGNAYVTDFYE